MKLDWLKLSPGMQIFCLFFSLFIGLIIGGVLIATFLPNPSSSLALKHIISSIFIFLFPVLACTCILKIYSKETFWSSPLHLIDILLSVLLLIVSFPLMEYCSRISSTISFESFAPQVQRYFDFAQQDSTNAIKKLFANHTPFTLVVNLIAIAVTPAIVEELFFRGCLQTTVMKFFKSHHGAIWTVAVVFSVFHLQIEGCITRAILGAFLGYLYYYGKNIIYPIVFHFFNNGIIVVSIYRMGVDKANDFQMFRNWDLIPILLITLASTALAVGVLYLFRKKIR